MQANKASILAVITNKLGDIALLISCTVLYSIFKTVDFAMISACAGYLPSINSDANVNDTATDYFIGSSPIRYCFEDITS